MSYYFAKTLDCAFDQAVSATRTALAEEGFGIITEVNVQATMKAKIGEDFRPYVILGACNPRMAFEALTLEDKVGVMLPCNVIVQDAGEGRAEVAMIDPAASMQAIDNPALKEKAAQVGEKLKAALARL
jgi:uncharacterized protein (DUF302 family)